MGNSNVIEYFRPDNLEKVIRITQYEYNLIQKKKGKSVFFSFEQIYLYEYTNELCTYTAALVPIENKLRALPDSMKIDLISLIHDEVTFC